MSTLWARVTQNSLLYGCIYHQAVYSFVLWPFIIIKFFYCDIHKTFQMDLVAVSWQPTTILFFIYVLYIKYIKLCNATDLNIFISWKIPNRACVAHMMTSIHWSRLFSIEEVEYSSYLFAVGPADYFVCIIWS